jgi:hypothetical protein
LRRASVDIVFDAVTILVADRRLEDEAHRAARGCGLEARRVAAAATQVQERLAVDVDLEPA